MSSFTSTRSATTSTSSSSTPTCSRRSWARSTPRRRPKRSRSRSPPACENTSAIRCSSLSPSASRASRSATRPGQLHSIAFLKELLDIARDVVAAEKAIPAEQDEDRSKAALTELFQEVQTAETPVVIGCVVDDIDEIVRIVHFPGWQQTSAGEREVKRALRGTLFKYKPHSAGELFEKAYGYVVQYY